MKKAAISLKDKSKLSYMKQLLKKKKLVYVTKKPDFVISLGGDGTLFYAERKYPEVPKMMIRDSKVCKKCIGDNNETILDFIRLNAYTLKESMKLEASFKNKRVVAVNDIVIRNKNPNQAIRFDVMIDNKTIQKEVIGDGLIIATPFGSTAYYQSSTRQSFNEGIGLAFNNTTADLEPINLKENQTIKVKLLRGDAHITNDNDSKINVLKEGSTITIKKHKSHMKLIQIEGL